MQTRPVDVHEFQKRREAQPSRVLTPPPNLDLELAKEISSCYADPLRFVKFAFPWGEPGGPLENYSGPDDWQADFLADLGREVRKRRFQGLHAVQPIRMAVASGHGIGKSTLVAWVVIWIMNTRPGARGTITANTGLQLTTKTWSQIQKWAKLAITSHWFVITNHAISHRNHSESWTCSAQTCRLENSEAFAGQHAADSTSFYVFDEASGVPDKIFEVAEGGLTDGEPMIFLFGNPTRNTGKFYRAVFGAERNRWNHRSIDSRKASFPNKTQIEEWVEDYGEDSDFVRVRVRDLPPKASDLQYIDSARIATAQKREVRYFPDDPLILGVDIARGGSDFSEIRFRRGADARSIPPIRISGEESRDSMRLVTILVQVFNTTYDGIKPSMAFVDGTGIGGPIVDRCRQLGYGNIVEIQFGWKAPDHHYANMRSYMWSRMREWLPHGAIDNSPQLETDLAGPGYHHNPHDQVVLESKEEMKKRGLDSPDSGDALALTFAQPVPPLGINPGQPLEDEEEEFSGFSRFGGGQGGWMR